MYAYKIKELAKRGTALLGAAGMLAGIGTSALPVLVSADALNPLTERSLTLSSSSPGWSYLDGSNNTTYAPPNSGANGQKTGNGYTFRMSSTGRTVKAITFQYCTTPAGACLAPGDNGFNTTGGAGNYTRNADSSSKTDLSIHATSPHEISEADWDDVISPEATGGSARASHTPLADNSEGNFVVLWGDASASATSADTYVGTSGGTADNIWALAAPTSVQTTNSGAGSVGDGTSTGATNFMKITSSTGQALSSTSGDYFKIVFFGTNTNYITNPGSGSFFVRINTYDDDTTLDATTIIDGGVTVANVMNESITIQTKVLETMDFSVGVFDPNTLTLPVVGGNAATNLPALTGASHVQCASLLMKDPTQAPADYSALGNNVLRMGDPNAEYSLKTNQAYDTHSYWRLSSNSSGGATVYYTGHTLTNTVNDQIIPLTDDPDPLVDASTASITGTEQFGLGLDVNTDTERSVASDTYGSGAGSFDDYVTGIGDPVKAHLPGLSPLVPSASYGQAAGTLGGGAQFAFNNNADTYAIPLASESTDVVNCVTAKMRYVANIAATTPAGVYTTKVNYVASPQY